MGQSASATIAFGVDLGAPGYDEWNFVTDEDGLLPAPWDGDESPEWDDLIAEFAGWSEVALPWGERGSAEYDARSEQYRRELTVRHSVGIEVDSYGYECSGTVLTMGGSQTVDWGCEEMQDVSEHLVPDSGWRLEQFIEFLDDKGLVLKGEYRRPRWLLMASYG